MTEKMTGKPYETGDLSIELDKRVKSKVAEFCGNEEYAFGDLKDFSLGLQQLYSRKALYFVSCPSLCFAQVEARG